MSKTKGWIYKETDDYITTFGTYSKDENDNIIEFGEVLYSKIDLSLSCYD